MLTWIPILEGTTPLAASNTGYLKGYSMYYPLCSGYPRVPEGETEYEISYSITLFCTSLCDSKIQTDSLFIHFLISPFIPFRCCPARSPSLSSTVMMTSLSPHSSVAMASLPCFSWSPCSFVAMAMFEEPSKYGSSAPPQLPPSPARPVPGRHLRLAPWGTQGRSSQRAVTLVTPVSDGTPLGERDGPAASGGRVLRPTGRRR